MLQTERSASLEDAMRAALNGNQAGLWTALPAIVESFDANSVTCAAQPSIQVEVRAQDGSTSWVTLPLLVDVPVCFPRGGGCTMTFPVTKGDEALIVFSSRCIDSWWQSGGVQVQAELRMHDLSDGFAILGPFSQATKIGGVSASSTQLRSNDGATYIDLNPTSQKVKIVAPGGFDVIAPLSTFSAAVTIQGLLTWAGGMVGTIASGVAASITGAINFVGTLTSNGHDISSTHKHTNSGGSGVGGPPQ